MKKNIVFILAILTLCVSCRLIDTLGGGEKAGTVDTLWSDVPPVPGATKSDMAVPLGARLMIRAAMQGKVNFISFKSTKTPQEVSEYYSVDRMKSAGWTPSQKGCIADTESKDNQGSVCFFDRKDSDKHEGLAIIFAEDPKSKETDIFYARLDMTEDKNSNSGKSTN